MRRRLFLAALAVTRNAGQPVALEERLPKPRASTKSET
jgi:hypothetical protein